MRFSYISPSPGLRDFVQGYLIAHFVFDPKEPAALKPYAPKPEQGITFFVKGRPSMVNPLTGEVHIAPPVCIFGQQVSRCDVRLPAEFLMIRVHFQPGALFRTLKIPLYELDGSYFDAELALRGAVRDVAERLAATQSYAEMIALVEGYLSRSVSGANPGVDRVDLAARRLMADPRYASLDRLAAQACLSPRQFNRKFTERIGVGPKLYSRVARFHSACLFKAEHPSIAWPTVAIELGYSDYQHLVRDFKQFTNATPNMWLLEDAKSPENAQGHSSAA